MNKNRFRYSISNWHQEAEFLKYSTHHEEVKMSWNSHYPPDNSISAPVMIATLDCTSLLLIEDPRLSHLYVNNLRNANGLSDNSYNVSRGRQQLVSDLLFSTIRSSVSATHESLAIKFRRCHSVIRKSHISNCFVVSHYLSSTTSPQLCNELPQKNPQPDRSASHRPVDQCEL